MEEALINEWKRASNAFSATFDLFITIFKELLWCLDSRYKRTVQRIAPLRKVFLFIMSYISYFSFTLWTSEALLISHFSTFHFYFSTLHFYFSTLQFLFFYIENPNPKFLNLRLNASSSMGTHCQVSSQLIKKIWIFLPEFLPQGGIEPGSPSPETSV